MFSVDATSSKHTPAPSAAARAERQERLAALRGLIAAHGGAARVGHERAPVPTGHPALDALVGGWVPAGVSEVSGRVGSGRVGVVLPALAAFTQSGCAVAVVDPLCQAHPPGLRGVVSGRLLVVRAAPVQAAWATEQLARCGAFGLVVLLDPLRIDRSVGGRLQRAAEEGGSSLVVVGELVHAALQARLRVEVLGWEAEGVRVRVRRPGRKAAAPGQDVLVLPARPEVRAEAVAPSVGPSLASRSAVGGRAGIRRHWGDAEMRKVLD